MPASTKKVTKPSLKTVAKATTKVLAKQARKGTRSLSTAEAARKLAKSPAAAAANAAIVAAREPRAATVETKAPNGAKGKIIAMIAADGGTSAAEVCKALGWARAGATIGRAIKLAGFKVAKVRDAEGVLRYSRVGG